MTRNLTIQQNEVDIKHDIFKATVLSLANQYKAKKKVIKMLEEEHATTSALPTSGRTSFDTYANNSDIMPSAKQSERTLNIDFMMEPPKQKMSKR